MKNGVALGGGSDTATAGDGTAATAGAGERLIAGNGTPDLTLTPDAGTTAKAKGTYRSLDGAAAASSAEFNSVAGAFF